MSDIWHTPTQTPDVFKPHPIIVIYEAGDEIEQMDSTEYSDLVGERYVNRWCYVDDLIKENERTRKALEIAVGKLKGIKAFYDDSYADPNTFVNWHIVAQRLANDADDAVKDITALEQKDIK